MNTQNRTFILRFWSEKAGGPIVAVASDGVVYDITNKKAPLVSDIFELSDPLSYVRGCKGVALGAISDALSGRLQGLKLLAPCDTQAIKAAGVTFVASMVERVIEERAAGDAQMADGIRQHVTDAIGANLRDIQPGSKLAEKAKDALLAQGLWSQYLEVGIGPEAEIFSKSQPLSAVAHGDQVGLHPMSDWNNPEPELVLAVSSKGQIIGATLGNDVNLRDVEGRSALLLSKAKDNNASCAIGPMIRLFDEEFTLDALMQQTLTLRISGDDGFKLTETCEMSQISRDPRSLVKQTVGAHHQYPDGFMLFLGTPFAPTQDRAAPGMGFTHHMNDLVSISTPLLGKLQNTVARSNDCAPWTFGTRALMRNLAKRALI